MPFYNVDYTFYVPTKDTMRVEANNPTDAEQVALNELPKVLAHNIQTIEIDMVEEAV